MPDYAIRVENLSKVYRIGLAEMVHDTLGEALVSWIKAPARNLRNLRRLNTFETDDAGEDLLWALKNLSFEVKHGEVLGIIGRNGAGKSTLLKVLSSITEPTAGSVTLHGREASLLEVGTGFHPELTGRENVYLNGTILGMTKCDIDHKFDEIVEFAGVAKFIETPIKRYSSGMKVRLAFSVAAHLDPEILIIDEVLAVGDAEFQRKCLGKMDQVAREGRTVLFVSHQMEAVQRLCDRCIWLDQGEIVEEGNTEAVISSYLSRSRQRLHWHYRRPGGADAPVGDSIVLEEAHLATLDGEPREHIRFGEPFMIRTEWNYSEGLAGVLFVIDVFDSSGRILFKSPSVDFSLARSGSGSVRADCRVLENVLLPGTYRLRVGAYLPPKSRLHVVDDCLSLVVDNVAHNGGPAWRGGRGLFAPQSAWSEASPAEGRARPETSFATETESRYELGE